MQEPVHLRPNCRVELPCRLDEVRRAVGKVSDFLLKQGCARAGVTDCELALVEACNNAVAYATLGRLAQPVLIEVTCEERAIEIRVVDHTAGFDWPQRVELPATEAERGRGLFLIRSLMDEAHYLRGREQNTLVLRKKKQCVDPQGAGEGPEARKAN